MSTARDTIEGSLRLIGVLATGETASAEEASDGLEVLNNMLDSWSIEGLVIHKVVREEFTLTPNTGSYSLGTSGTFNTTRPFRIERATIELQGSDPQEIPLRLLTAQEWAATPLKSTTSSIPTDLYAEGTFPLETLNLWPVPTAAEKLVLYTLKPLTNFASLSTEVSLPPGYSKALRYGLAEELAAEYGKEPPAVVLKHASESKANIKRINAKPRFLSFDSALTGRRTRFDYRTGE